MSDSPWTSPGGGDDAPGTDVPPPGATPPPSGWSSSGGPPPPPPPGAHGPPPPPPPGRGRDGRRLVPLRPLQLGELLDAAFRLVRANAAQLVVLVLLTVGVLTVLQQLVLPSELFSTSATLTPQEALDQITADRVVLGLVPLVLLQLVVTPVVNGAVTRMGIATDRGEDDSWGTALRWGLRHFGRLVGTALLAALVLLVAGGGATVLGILLVAASAEVVGVGAVLVGIVVFLGVAVLVLGLYATLYVAIPVVVVEDVGPATALRRSVTLLRPQLLRTIGVVLVAGLLVAVFGVIAGVASVPLGLVGGVTARLGSGVLTALTQAVTVPFSAFVALLVYTDARVRREGLDVAVMAAELGER